jgi:Flp pilus assembly protein CpaB
MGMQFGSENRRRRVLVALGLLLAAIAAIGVFVLVSRPAATPPVIPTSSVLVAVVDIPARTLIEPGQVALADVPQSAVVAQAVTAPEQAVARLTAVQIYAGQQITPNLLAGAIGEEFAILDPEETISPDSPAWRAISVTVTDDRAVGGKLRAGQFVDIIATLTTRIIDIPECDEEEPDLTPEPFPIPAFSPGVYCDDQSTKITFENMRILLTIPETSTYILRADLHQAEELTLIQDRGDALSIVLRPDRDTRVIDRLGYGETFDRLMRQYRYTIPEILYLIDFVPNPPPGDLPSPAP